MIEKLEQSSGNTIGFKVSGTITKKDYAIMVPEVEALVDQEGDINMLLDLSEFHWEEIGAWGADMKFGSTYRKKINKMAIVGDKKWQKWLTHLVDPFYAREAEFFQTEDSEAAWAWLNEA
ncbi:MAG TPA: STAS/SEC14 domain-containing protein [Caldilineae bacterium]|nr:STAS/SEC14 domain-containing protein [Caldilineae bacterium]